MSSNVHCTYEEVYLTYKAKVCGYVENRIHYPHDAEDVVSAIFVKIYTALESYDEGKAHLSTWIYRITHNAVCDYYREKNRLGEAVPIEDCAWLEAPQPEVSPDEKRLETLATALSKLSPRERDVVILRFYKELSPAQVAETMDISYANAKYIQHTAIEKLRKLLKP